MCRDNTPRGHGLIIMIVLATVDINAPKYLYWAITSVLRAQQEKSRREDIRHEWKLHSKELVRTRDPHIYELIADPKFKLPTRLPGGKYRTQ